MLIAKSMDDAHASRRNDNRAMRSHSPLDVSELMDGPLHPTGAVRSLDVVR